MSKKKPVRWWVTRDKFAGSCIEIWSSSHKPAPDGAGSFYKCGDMRQETHVLFNCDVRKAVVPFPIRMGQCIEIEPPVLRVLVPKRSKVKK